MAVTLAYRVVAQAHYWLAGPMTYGEVRPVPLVAIKAHKPNVTDCSGGITGLFYTVGAPDPNGGDYSRTELMYTGTLIHAGPHVNIAQAQLADIIIYARGGQTFHAALVVEAGQDPLLWSHGGPNGAKPGLIRLSAESAYHARVNQAVAVCVRPDLPATKPVVPVTTITAGDGSVLARTRFPVLWQRKHPGWQGHNQITLRRNP